MGYGFLHVPCPIPGGYLPIKTYYTPALRTTVINERNFLSTLLHVTGEKRANYPTEQLIKHHHAGTFTYHCAHRNANRHFKIHGVLLQDKCFTHESIAPILSPDDPQADPTNSIQLALDSDPEFRREVAKATIYSIFAYQDIEMDHLREDLDQLPFDTASIPVEDYVKRNTPILAIKQATERLLWHQRLGHASHYYLTEAHRHVKGIPKFPHMVPIFNNCPTCLRAKLTKQPAGPHSTRTATAPFQGLSINFSFSGNRSKNPEHNQDYLGMNGHSCWILVSDHFTRYLVGDTWRSKASPLKWLEAFLTKHSPNCADKYVVLDLVVNYITTRLSSSSFADFTTTSVHWSRRIVSKRPRRTRPLHCRGSHPQFTIWHQPSHSFLAIRISSLHAYQELHAIP